MKHFSKMTEAQRDDLIHALENTAVEYFQSHGFSGLSHAGWFSVYEAIQNAIWNEWHKAKYKNQDAELERLLSR